MPAADPLKLIADLTKRVEKAEQLLKEEFGTKKLLVDSKAEIKNLQNEVKQLKTGNSLEGALDQKAVTANEREISRLVGLIGLTESKMETHAKHVADIAAGTAANAAAAKVQATTKAAEDKLLARMIKQDTELAKQHAALMEQRGKEMALEARLKQLEGMVHTAMQMASQRH